MLHIFAFITKLLRVKRIHIEGQVFWLNSTFTVFALLAIFSVNTIGHLWESPVNCDVDKKSLDQKIVNQYCYVKGTFTLAESDPHSNPIYPGVAVAGRPNQSKFEEQLDYYQWTWCLLLAQAVFFYLPRWVWKWCESDRISSLVSDLSYFGESEVREKKMVSIVNYLCRMSANNYWYAVKYLFCELITLLNVIIQFFVIDAFLYNQFLWLGFDYIGHQLDTNHTTLSPIIKIFPLMSNCRYKRSGMSGSLDDITYLCVLSINLINQVIFLAIWFWYFFLLVLSALLVMLRLILVFCPPARYYLYRNFWDRFDCKHIKGYRTRQLVHELHLGDWFMLRLLGRNVDPIVFSEIVEKLCHKYQISYPANDNFAEELVSN